VGGQRRIGDVLVVMTNNKAQMPSESQKPNIKNQNDKSKCKKM
jgi:hypothetical protein